MPEHPAPHQPDPTKPPLSREYHHLTHTLNLGPPPPADDTPEALLARNQAAIDQVAATMPTNANEAAWATQCVAARAQADAILRLMREHAGADLKTIMKLKAHYIAMTRASQGAHSHLLCAGDALQPRDERRRAQSRRVELEDIVTRSMEQSLEAGPAAAMPEAEPSAPASVAEPRVNAPEQMPLASEPAALLPPSASPPPLASSPAPMSVPAAPWPALPPVRDKATAPRSSRRVQPPAPLDDPPRDLLADAEYYAAVYPRRAREIRRCCGLPPDCSFGPPDDDLLRTLLTSNSAALRALDDMSTAAD